MASRNIRFVDAKFQIRMMKRAALPISLVFIAAMAGVYVFTQPGGTYTVHDYRIMGFIGMSILFLASIAGIFWSLFLYSSRLAGPLKNLRRTLEIIASGDLTVRARVRKEDELQEQVEYLNRAILSIHERVKRIHQFCRYTRSTVEQMRQSGLTEKNLDQLLDLVKSIEESVTDFKVG